MHAVKRGVYADKRTHAYLKVVLDGGQLLAARCGCSTRLLQLRAQQFNLSLTCFQLGLEGDAGLLCCLELLCRVRCSTLCCLQFRLHSCEAHLALGQRLLLEMTMYYETTCWTS